ncbi:MAG: DUF6600 domain-containing protein [Vulcanimicrobiaceae bacterium]
MLASKIRLTIAAALGAQLAVLGLASAPARAAGSAPNVARISLIRGNVDVHRSDANEDVAASINAPLLAGDYLSTGSGGARAEVQYDAFGALRLAPDTQIRFTQLDPGHNVVQLAQGTVELRLFRSSDDDIQTPTLTVHPDEAGAYDVTVTSNGQTQVTVREGHADLISDRGTTTIGPGSTTLADGTPSNASLQTVAEISDSDFDAWTDQRDLAYERAFASPDEQYDTYVGYQDLGDYGHWADVGNYGNVWIPYETAGWAPYHDGRWAWEPYYGWTWVGYEPWGWAPYHYGRWFYANDYGWCWWPGAVYAQPIWQPALVGFFSFGGGGSFFSLGFGGIGWVPLAPYETYYPWWGARRGWGYDGWGGRRWVRVPPFQSSVTYVNITHITNIYQNVNAPGGVVGINSSHFGNGMSRPISISPHLLGRVAVAHGVVPIVPTRSSLGFTRGTVPNRPVALSPHFARLAAPRADLTTPVFASQQHAVQRLAQNAYRNHPAIVGGPRALAPIDRVGAHQFGSHTVVTGTAATRPVDAHPVGAGPLDLQRGNDPWARFGESGPRGLDRSIHAAPAAAGSAHGFSGTSSRFAHGTTANPATLDRGRPSHPTNSATTNGGRHAFAPSPVRVTDGQVSAVAGSPWSRFGRVDVARGDRTTLFAPSHAGFSARSSGSRTFQPHTFQSRTSQPRSFAPSFSQPRSFDSHASQPRSFQSFSQPRSFDSHASQPRSFQSFSQPRSFDRMSSQPRDFSPHSFSPQNVGPRNFSPQNSAPHFSAPHFSAPHFSAPHVSAPSRSSDHSGGGRH